jgi:putative transposase
MWRGHSCPRKSDDEDGMSSRFEPTSSQKLCRNAKRGELAFYDEAMRTATFRRYEYRRRLPHYQRDDRPLFVTFCALRSIELSPEARSLTLKHCLHDNGRTIRLHAAVVMPNRVHLLLTALRDAEGWTFALPDILKATKGTSARSINNATRSSGPVWQDESFDHVMRGDESLRETVEYIRQNPVRKGLVRKAEDYLWLWVSPEIA